MTRWILALMFIACSTAHAGWFDGTDEEFEPYIAQYNKLKRTNAHSLRFVRHERPGASPDTYQCSLITTSTFMGLVPVKKDVSVFVNSKFWAQQKNKQEFLNTLLDSCLNAQQ